MVLAGALLAASLAVWLLADRMPPEERSDKALLPAPLGPMILLEPRQAGGELKPFVIAADAAAARQQCLALGDVTDEQLRAAAGGPEYALTVPGSAGYRVWVRAWWLDGCANSCLVAIDDQPPVTIGNDSTYRVWHWVRGPVMDISAGPHILRLLPREANVRVDQILLAANHAYQPHGVLADSGAPAFVPPDPGPPPVWPSADRPGKAPFLAGIGGMFQAGPEAFMVRLGIPYRRLRDDEVHDLATLEKFNLVWISSREGTVRQSTAAVEAYVSAGGTAIIENGHMMYPEGADLIGPLRLTPRTMAGGVSVKAAGAPLLRRLPDCPLPEKVRVCGIRDAEPATGCEMHGQLFQGNDLLGPVFVKKRIGRGTVYFLCVPLGHVSLWKGKWFDQVTEDILRDAVDGRCDWLFAGLSWNPKAAGAGRLDDEFMRSKGAEWPGWQVISGQVEHTGSAPSDRSLAFSLRAGKGACVQYDRPMAGIRLSASLLAESGAGGIWVITTQKRGLELLYDGRRQSLGLCSQIGSKRELLHEAAVPSSRRGWHRLSLFNRSHTWEAWLDGKRCFTVGGDNEQAGAPFGMLSRQGIVYFDDLHVRHTSELLAGRDVCVGEEGSSRADAPFARGNEPQNIYSPVWWLRPDPQRRHAVQLAMPIYTPAYFSMDNTLLGTVMPNQEAPLVYLPEGRSPKRQIEVTCPTWRDYCFGGRLVEWYGTGGIWAQLPRWACDDKWLFLGVNAHKEAILWQKQQVSPPYAFSVLVGPALRQVYYDRDAARDLNLVLGGNGRDLDQGYTIRTGAIGTHGCQVWHRNTSIAANPAIGLPLLRHRGRFELHNRWVWLKVVVEERRLRLYYEDQLALDHPLPAPVPRGQLGFWTRNNAVRIARATLSASE